MTLLVNLGELSYDIVIERGSLQKASSYLNLDRKVLIITDSGVPSEYAETIKSQCKNGYIVTIPQGEKSKNFDNYKMLLEKLCEYSFTRTDAVVAVGGGVCGDLSGFVASSYMRGIDFYNIPTTLLSQLDSSIGGKVAIDLNGIKNIVGAFYQPKKVIIDIDTLKTLDKRQFSAGLCEGIKMAATFDKELFELIEKTDNIEKDIDEIIEKSLKIKRDVVEKDPKEKNLRKVLNFGHTIGHAVESYEMGRLLHGECVAIGMIPFSSKEVANRLIPVLKKYNLPYEINVPSDELYNFITHDKKSFGSKITVIECKEIGTFEMNCIEITEIKKYLDGEAQK
jgi:3-dehydroquinate synthase